VLPDIVVLPVGVVRSPLTDPRDAPCQRDEGAAACRIELTPDTGCATPWNAASTSQQHRPMATRYVPCQRARHGRVVRGGCHRCRAQRDQAGRPSKTRTA
jgi:hypothetical protein